MCHLRGTYKAISDWSIYPFYTSVPIKYKRNSIEVFIYHAEMVCFDDIIENELNNIYRILDKNGFPAKFINEHMNETKIRPMITTIQIGLQLISEALKC